MLSDFQIVFNCHSRLGEECLATAGFHKLNALNVTQPTNQQDLATPAPSQVWLGLPNSRFYLPNGSDH